MDILGAVALLLSGGIVASSVILSSLGFSRKAISRRGAVIIAAMGVGLGVGIFVFLGISGGDYIGSLVVGMIASATAGLAMHFML